MYILYGVGFTLLGILLILLVIIALRPAEFRIERSGQVNARREVVFGLINDFHQWVQWSPWEKLDPTMKKTYEGPAAGAGSVYSWVGNKKVGEGRMTMLESAPSERVVIKLEFFKPFAATNTATFTVTPAGDGNRSLVHWAMDGRNNFMGKAFCMVMNMDKLVGTDFEKGLANMNTAAERSGITSAQRSA